MADSIIVAEFSFVANKSFAADNHPITIPARFQQALKDCGLADAAKAKVNFREEPSVSGNIRAGWRAGGRYYQITTLKCDRIAAPIGTTLAVRVLKTPEEWLVQIR